MDVFLNAAHARRHAFRYMACFFTESERAVICDHLKLMISAWRRIDQLDNSLQLYHGQALRDITFADSACYPVGPFASIAPVFHDAFARLTSRHGVGG